MKLLQLDLTAFGIFTETSLNFSHETPNFHIIYGANEAGKSTTRRALMNALFGIPERSADGFLHGNEQLKLSVLLRKQDGSELFITRRKGRKNTLLNAENRVIEENVLTQFLGQLTEQQFTTLFCFDHEQLRKGGEDLLSSGGNVGESLFEAGTGHLRLHEVLEDLDREATELFKPRASKPRLNQMIRQYKESCEDVKQHSLSASRWAEYAKALDEAREKYGVLSTHLHELQAEQHRLRRIQRTLPLLKRYQSLTQELAGMSQILVLPDDSATRRVAATVALREAQEQQQQAQQSIENLQTELQAIVLPTELMQQRDLINQFRERLGSHQKAARDIPGVRTEMRTVEGEAQMLSRRIYPQCRLEDLLQFAITDPQRDKIKVLAEEYPALREKQTMLADRLEKNQQQLMQHKMLFNQLPNVPELSELKAAINHTLKQGDLEQQFTKTEKEVRLLQLQSEIALKQLGLWTGSLEGLENANLIGAERVEEFDRHFKELENDRQRIKERLLEARHRLAEATRKLDALRWAGEVPTESDLLKARELRQQRWQLLKHAQPTQEMYQTFEEAMTHADEIADRLRREAQRVTEQATLLAEQQNARQEQENQSKKWRLSDEQLAKLQAEWEETWRPLNIKPYSPSEMRSWLMQCQTLRRQLSSLRELRHQLEVKQQLIAELCQELAEAMSHLPNPTLPLTRLHDLLEQAQSSLADFQNLRMQRDSLEKQIAGSSQEQNRLENNLSQARQALEDWQREWRVALEPLQLPVDTLPETARNVLHILDQIYNKMERISGLRRRIERMEEDAQVFSRDVENLVMALAPELMDKSLEQVIPTLSERLRQAERDATRYEQLQQRLIAEQQRLTTANGQAHSATLQLNRLLEQAHCQQVSELENAEQNSKLKKQREQQFIETEKQLHEQGEGLSLIELAEAAAAVKVDELHSQLQTIQGQIQILEQERSELDQKIGELRTLLKQMDGNAAAAQAAGEAQLALAEMQDLTERYVQVHLAATVLRRSIERYREQHQAPLIQRTSELFSQLTLGNFSGVKTGYNSNNEAVLLGVRHPTLGGITTTSMSDGTRDQLFLALRLASLERYAEKYTPYPLLLDDILVNFDDRRSSAALRILQTISQKTQILFFTHHPHLVELAKQTVGEQRFVLHELTVEKGLGLF